LSAGITAASTVYLLAGTLLLTAAAFFVKADVEKMKTPGAAAPSLVS
jgi:hypothetical protein